MYRYRMIAIVLTLLLSTAVSDATGDLVVNVAGGTEVFVDGIFFGTASTAGLTINGLAIGAHKVLLRAPATGGTASFNVNIIEAQVQTINVSPLGFRIKPKSETPVAAVRVLSDVVPCTVSVGDVTAEKTSHELNIGSVPIGRHRILIVCGNRRAEAMLSLNADELQIIEPDFDKRVANVVSRRRRVTELKVAGGQDEIVNSSMPVEWKRVLSSAAGEARAVNVTPVSYTTVIITYRCSSQASASSVVDRIKSSGIVDRVDVQSIRRDGERLLLTLRVRFLTGALQ
jgi:hypothetical protein